MAEFVSALDYDPMLSIPIKDMKNYIRKARFHLGKILKYAFIPPGWPRIFAEPLREKNL